MRPIQLRFVQLFAFGVLARSTAAQESRVLPPRIQTLLRLDSTEVGAFPTTSIDNRWVAFTKRMPSGSSAIWMAALPDGKPFRITSDGFVDWGQSVAPAGDRVFFLSNRPIRNPAASKSYLMSVAIDRATGRPTGSPRQVTTDEVYDFSNSRSISPDGRLVVYSTRPPHQQVRIVPSNGGMPRTLATATEGVIDLAMFSSDGREVLYSQSQPGRKYPLIKVVSLSTGAVRTFNRDGGLSYPYPADPRYTVRLAVSDSGIYSYHLMDSTSRLVDSIVLPIELSRPPSFGYTRGDGRGILGWKNDRATTLREMSLSSGAIHAIRGWPADRELVGVAADGSFIGRGFSKGHLSLWLMPPDGSKGREIDPGPGFEAASVLVGGRFVILRGTVSPDRTRAFHALDLSTGATRLLLKPGKGGESDTEGRTVGIFGVEGDSVRYFELDASAALHRGRAFSLSLYDTWDDDDVRGSRFAFAVPTKKADSVSIQVATADGAPQTIATLPYGDDDDAEIAWSPSGRRLAVYAGYVNHKTPIYVFDVRDNGSLAGPPLQLEMPDERTQTASIRWTRDESTLIVPTWRGQAPSGPRRFQGFVLRPVDVRRPLSVFAKTEAPQFPAYPAHFSADGRSLLFTGSQQNGALIWTAVFSKR